MTASDEVMTDESAPAAKAKNWTEVPISQDRHARRIGEKPNSFAKNRCSEVAARSSEVGAIPGPRGGLSGQP